jgi:2,5-furandicarboxylate decarboxylase 1
VSAERDLRTYLERLRGQGDLLTVSRRIDARTEAPALIDAAMRAGKVIRFDRVGDSPFPLVGGILGSRRILAQTLGSTAERLHQDYVERIRNPAPARRVSNAPVKEVIEKNADPYSWPLLPHRINDAGPYLTSGVATARDPQTGRQNLSFNRMQLKEKERFGFSMLATQDLAQFYRRYCDMGKPMPVAVAVGLHPVELLAAAVHTDRDEVELAGALRGEPVDVVQCETSDLLVPAHAEMILEGEILGGNQTEDEGPFGDWLGYYQPQSKRHVFQLKCVTRRARPIFVSMMAGSVEDHLLLGFPREVDVLRATRENVRGIKRVHMAPFLLNCVIQMDKRLEGEPMTAAYAAFGACPWLKTVIVVDEDVDPSDMDDVMWAVATRCKANDGLAVLANAAGFARDSLGIYRHKIAIDATVPLTHRNDIGFKRIREANRGQIRLIDYVDQQL